MCSKCVYLFLKNYDCVVKEYYFILFKEKKRRRRRRRTKRWARWRKKNVEMCKREFGLVNRPQDVQFIYKTTIQKHYLKTKSKYMF